MNWLPRFAKERMMISLSNNWSPCKAQAASRVVILLVLLSFIKLLSAQTFAVESLPTITLEEAKSRAISNNSSYQASQAGFNASSWNRRSAFSNFLPSLSLSGSYLYNDPALSPVANKDMRSVALNLSQPVFLGGKLWQGYKMARLGEEIADLSLKDQRYALEAEVESKYLGVLQLRSLYLMARTDQQGAQSNLAKAELKLQTGMLSQADYLRFQASLAAKDLALQQAETALQLSLQDFANYLGEKELIMPSELDFADDQTLLSTLSGYDQGQTQSLTDRALQMLAGRNLNLQIMDKSVELSERAYKIARASFWPTVMLTGSRKYSENGIDRYEFDASNQLILSASLPILPGLGNYAATRKAKEEARQVQLEALAATDGIRLGVQSAVLSLISKAKQVQSTALNLSYTEQLYAQLGERFNLNMISASELLDAELMLSGARISNTGAMYEYLNARRDLMRALVLEDTHDFSQLIFE